MPELDLTPAPTVKDLDGISEHCYLTAEKYKVKGKTKESEFYREFQREYEIELYVAEFIASIKGELICR
tara:strand:+ start:2079 stop:2285 length:207 start_codon:yes stop_codon:yes gene_type:complete